MPVGNDATMTVASYNALSAQTAIQLRLIMSQIFALATDVNNLGSTGLQAVGFTSADATELLNNVDYMLTIYQIYIGQVQQGGSGGTGASTFNFQNALTALTGPY
jgi:hypothetical protein